ncbi:MFS transporter [Nocardia pseudobrasiliensis]|uniref:EmrB/QacA subfamily drug resistance transporter n=1 Tax=Nocardia pseudobrasiliensis TaxID=45979 RepID=A0A370HWJ9_9NOCA|nr:MFS transporter [Nocardia pseudobrasiliensis]RDI62862.1 EmrB/QacA subfamily drug resistance transporter [Nocardia pseudobrasiliensis]
MTRELLADKAAATQTGSIGLAEVVAVSIGNFLVAFDATAVYVALPSIAADLHAGTAAGQWFLDAYTIALSVFLLVSGALGDRIGAARVYRWSLLAFLLASVACAVATTPAELITARAVQGVSASFALPMTLAILTKGVPDPVRRSRTIGAWGVVGGVGIASAPILSGLITGYLGWRWLFLINVPVCLIALLLMRSFRDRPADRQARFAFGPQALLCVVLVAIASVLIEGHEIGYGDARILALAAVALAGLVALGWLQARSEHPMIPRVLSGNRSFLLIVFGGGCYQFASYGSLLVLSLYLQRVHGMSVQRAGYALLVCCVAWFAGNVLALRVTPANRRAVIIGMAATGAVGAIATAALSETGSLTATMIPTAAVGLAAGMLASSLSAATMHVAPAEVSGSASGLLNTSRQCGMALAIAALGAMATGALFAPMVLIGVAFAVVCAVGIAVRA